MANSILGFIARRLLLAVPVFVGVTLVTFVLMQIVPGDPVALLMEEKVASVDPDAARIIRAKWGLDDPVPLQYLKFLRNAVRGDLGISYRTDRSVLASILERVPATATLAVAALGLAILIGVATGIIAALRQNTMFDSASIIFATIGVSIPNFWLGLLLIYLLAVQWRWLPPSGYGPAYPYLIMPAITLGTALSAVIARLTRSSMLDVIRADYIRTARAKGLADRRVLLAHALRNAAIPIITVIGVQLSGLLSGTVITERVFSWPGIGRLLVDSIAVRDLPMVQGCVLFIATVFIGLALGLLSGFYGGWVDNLIMRLAEIIFAFPGLLFAIAIMAVIGPSLYNVFLALGLVSWTALARLVRGQVLTIKHQEYVDAARALGASNARIIVRHILPNVAAAAIVLVTLGIGSAILAEASLSFLGLGAQPPTPSWGSMLSTGRDYLRQAPWLSIYPGLAIFLTVMGFNLLGDGLRDLLDPRMQT